MSSLSPVKRVVLLYSFFFLAICPTCLSKKALNLPTFVAKNSLSQQKNDPINDLFQRNIDDQKAVVATKRKAHFFPLDSRGGACDDSDPILFLKIALSSLLETAALLGILVGSTKLSSQFSLPSFLDLSILQWLSMVLVIFFPSIIGAITDGGLSAASNQVLMPNMTPGDINWYQNLKKPAWSPPGWLFPIMWLLISKPTQLIAVSKILKNGEDVGQLLEGVVNIKNTDLPIGILTVYCSQLAIGDAWNKVFFGLQCPGRGAVVITLFWGLLLTSAFLFGTLDVMAGRFLLPTCGWVSVAAALNLSIYFKNK